MTITPTQAHKLLAASQHLAGGTADEVTVSVSGIKLILDGREAFHIQGLPLYLYTAQVDGVASYVLSKAALERLAERGKGWRR